MAGPERRSSGIGRNVSLRTSIPSASNLDENELGDVYGLEAMGIADGFRPSNGSSNHNRMSSRTSHQEQTRRRSTPPPRPSSTTKPRNLDNFSLRHDGAMGAATVAAHHTASSSSSSTITRSSSVSTDAPIMIPEGPYQGPARPSHPYQMYPQNTRPTRTASVATTSTFAAPLERGYTGPSGPTHPYGLYPQNTVPETEGVEPLPNSNIPVGFPGRVAAYQRRLGPDGEEAADIIGPDGHTEQLPPYSKYPDEAFARKVNPTGLLPAGAGGIGLATRNPEFASREDLTSPVSRHSAAISEGSSQMPTTPVTAVSEKPPEKGWKAIARRKACGIVPYWALVLAGLVILICVVVVGAVMGVIASKRKPLADHWYGTMPSDGVYYTTVTTTFDATPLATLPTGLPSIQTGSWGLIVGNPNIAQPNCIDNSLTAAWSCSMPPSSMEMTIKSLDSSTSNIGNNKITITQADDRKVWAYGTQPPVISEEQQMTLVQDSSQSQYGPAWFFQMPYDKLVIVPETSLSAPSKRDGSRSPGPDSWRRKGLAAAGDKPWFCYWNGTLLEAFVYVNTTSAAGAEMALVSSSSAAAVATGGTWKNFQYAAHGADDIPFHSSFDNSWTSQYQTPGQTPTPISTSTPATSSDISGTPVISSASSASTSSTSDEFDLPQFYPQIVKLEERRMPRQASFDKPYCIQMTINKDNTATPIMGTNGPNKIMLNEKQVVSVKREYGDITERESVPILAERDDSTECTCAWVLI